MIKNLRYIHKILGIILSILFIMWFLSGIVLMYHSFPKVNELDREKKFNLLHEKSPHINDYIDLLELKDSIFSTIKIYNEFGKDICLFKTKDSSYYINNPLDLRQNDSNCVSIAKKWVGGEIIKIDTLSSLDTWIPFDKYLSKLPIYKFYFNDTDKHQVYIASKSKQVIQRTTQKDRFWAKLGAIPHWIYFYQLRQHRELWINSVIILSFLGTIMVIIGLILGCKFYKTKYVKTNYRWHKYLGLTFGVFTLTWIFSGMMSLCSVPTWITGLSKKQITHFSPYENYSVTDFKLDYRGVINKTKAKSIEWVKIYGIPTYIVLTEKDQLLYIDARNDSTIQALNINDRIIKSFFDKNRFKIKDLKLISEYDNFYIDVKEKLPLPVYKVSLNDNADSHIYIDPLSDKYSVKNKITKIHFILYKALHSFEFKCFVGRNSLREYIMIFLLFGGTALSFTGLLFIIKKRKRKCKKAK